MITFIQFETEAGYTPALNILSYTNKYLSDLLRIAFKTQCDSCAYHFDILSEPFLPYNFML